MDDDFWWKIHCFMAGFIFVFWNFYSEKKKFSNTQKSKKNHALFNHSIGFCFCIYNSSKKRRKYEFAERGIYILSGWAKEF